MRPCPTALELHQAGRYADAARCYHGLLSREPDNADALHLFGVMHHQCGYSSRAVELIGRAVALRPGAAAFHANLAEVHRTLGQYEQAVDCCRTALRLAARLPRGGQQPRPGPAGARPARGSRRAVPTPRCGCGPSSPWHGTTWASRCATWAGTTRPSRPFARPSPSIPTWPWPAPTSARLLVDPGEADEALTHCQEAVRLQPDLAAAPQQPRQRLCAPWSAGPRRTPLMPRRLRLSPELGGAKVHANLGLALQREGQFAQAVACFRRAVELAPRRRRDLAVPGQRPRRRRGLRRRHPLLRAHRRARAGAAARAQRPGLGACRTRAASTEAAACLPPGPGAAARRPRRPAQPGPPARGARRHGRGRGLLSASPVAIHPAAPAPLARLATLLRGRLPDDDRQAIAHSPRRSPARRRAARPPALRPGPCLRRPRRLRRGRRLPRAGQCPGPGTASQARTATTTRPSTPASSTG